MLPFNLLRRLLLLLIFDVICRCPNFLLIGLVLKGYQPLLTCNMMLDVCGCVSDIVIGELPS